MKQNGSYSCIWHIFKYVILVLDEKKKQQHISIQNNPFYNVYYIHVSPSNEKLVRYSFFVIRHSFFRSYFVFRYSLFDIHFSEVSSFFVIRYSTFIFQKLVRFSLFVIRHSFFRS